MPAAPAKPVQPTPGFNPPTAPAGGTTFDPTQVYGLGQNEQQLPISVGYAGLFGGAIRPPDVAPGDVSKIAPQYRGEVGAGVAQPNMTVLQLEQEFWSLPVYQQIQIEQKLWAGGFYGDTKTPPDFGQPSSVVDTSKALYNAAYEAFVTHQRLDDMVSQAAATGANKQQVIPGIAGHGPNDMVDLRNPNDVAYTAQAIFQNALGRAPTQAEIDAVTKTLQSEDFANGKAKFQAAETTAEQEFQGRQFERDQQAAASGVGGGADVSGNYGVNVGPSTGPWSIFKQGGGDSAAVGWAQGLLQALGAPVTPGNLQFVYDWEVSEGGGGKYNPLNQGPVPGQPQLTTTGSQYGGGAADFASPAAGIQGAVAYLNMGNYAGVKNALMNNDPAAARRALIASPWAGGHYGGGSGFSSKPVPAGAAQALGGSAAAIGGAAGAAAAAAGGGTGAAAAGGGNAPTQSFIDTAESQIGVAYLGGGEAAGQGFDCSGLVQWAMKQNGFDPGRTTTDQFSNPRGASVPDLASALPGDLIFFGAGGGPNGGPSHVGIYLGNGQMLDADNTGGSVGVRKNVAGYGNIAGIKRFPVVGGAAGTTGPNDQFTPGTLGTAIAPTSTEAAAWQQATTGPNLLPFGAHTMLNAVGTINNMIRGNR